MIHPRATGTTPSSATGSARSSEYPVSTEPSGSAGATQIALWQQLTAVAHALESIRAGQSGTAALSQVSPQLRPGVQSLLFQVLRQAGRAEVLRRALADRTPRPAVDALLCTALALCWDPADSPYDAFTLVNQTVEAAKRSKTTHAQASFINGCLRRFLREREALVAQTDNDVLARWNHPLWWVRRLQHDHPDHWEQILHANNQHAPMVLRINGQKSTQALYLLALAAINFESKGVGMHGVALARPVPVQSLPGFAEGWVSVQDAAAQQAAPLLLNGLDLGQPLRILDACAAPGGKTAHLLEMAPPGAPLHVTALEIDAERSQRIDETLKRLGLKAQVLVADAARPQDWWQQHCGGVLFDAILLDAPCTASGIVRRHPDVRWLRRESDIAQLATLQRRLLAALWPLVRPGGRLLFCTCSVFRAEGDAQAQTFLAHNTDAVLLPSPGHLIPGNRDGRSSVPDNPSGDHDGFFYALFQKAVP